MYYVALTGVFSAMFPDGGVAVGIRKSTGAVGSLTIIIKATSLSDKLFFNVSTLMLCFSILKYFIHSIFRCL